MSWSGDRLRVPILVGPVADFIGPKIRRGARGLFFVRRVWHFIPFMIVPIFSDGFGKNLLALYGERIQVNRSATAAARNADVP